MRMFLEELVMPDMVSLDTGLLKILLSNILRVNSEEQERTETAEDGGSIVVRGEN
ncbi:hypothetical protein QJS10_CPB13g01707 [Acorus calamus]|uniref:Uncharacterized protein n=1 Tax=Acorus calamus TaxID=4465 RepID=A0AAV9DIG2_ACOCL|nr:hypothetical protein QJS10_CPB13g01707 [Acorus calamus]